MKYKCFKEFKGKDLNSNSLTVPVGAELTRNGDMLYYNDQPVCIWRSQVAKAYMVWDGDGCADERLGYLNTIVFGPREVSWTELVKEVDENGNEVGEKLETRTDRYTPDEAQYMLEHFPQFFNEDWRFNDYFYVGSHISEQKDLANYLNRENKEII